MKSVSKSIWGKSLFFASACLAGACAGPQHIRPYTPRHRNYDPGDYAQAPRPVSTGSLWNDHSRGLFADSRATEVGDTVTVHIDETPNARGSAGTEMDRDSNTTLGANIPLFGITQALQAAYPGLDPNQLISMMSQSGFNGDGNTSRASRVQADIAVKVKQVMPNGDLFVEGNKVLMINDEELHIYLSGVIRTEDIDYNNAVSSSLLADAQVEFTGRGNLTENSEQGWLSQLVAEVNPF